MNHTNYVILKLLFQQPLKEIELLKYLNIRITTLRKAILEINMKLVELKLPVIEKKNYIYRIFLSKKERNFFYKSCNEYSRNQRVNYLSLKILIEKSLNLETELNLLNISRSTITRDILIVKNKLKEKKICLISKRWEGVFYKVQDENSFYECVCELLITLYSEYNNLPGILKAYLEFIQPKKIETTLSELFQVFDYFNLQTGNMTIRYFLALNVCFSKFKNFYLNNVLNYTEKIKNTSSYKIFYSRITTIKNLNEKSYPYICMIIYDTASKTFYLEKEFEDQVNLYCKYFNLTLDSNERYLLNFFLYLSSFRYKHDLYDVKNIYLTSESDNKILKELEKFLKKIGLNMLYGDLLELMDFTKYFFIKNNKNNYKRILILKMDINISYYIDIRERLKQNYPNFIFEIKPHAYIYVTENIKESYDLVLSDTILDSSFNYKLCQVNMSLMNMINNYLIEDYLEHKK